MCELHGQQWWSKPSPEAQRWEEDRLLGCRHSCLHCLTGACGWEVRGGRPRHPEAQPEMYTTAQGGECKEGCQCMLHPPCYVMSVSTLLAGIQE